MSTYILQGRVFKAKVSFSKKGKNIEAKSRSMKYGLFIFRVAEAILYKSKPNILPQYGHHLPKSTLKKDPNGLCWVLIFCP